MKILRKKKKKPWLFDRIIKSIFEHPIYFIIGIILAVLLLILSFILIERYSTRFDYNRTYMVEHNIQNTECFRFGCWSFNSTLFNGYDTNGNTMSFTVDFLQNYETLYDISLGEGDGCPSDMQIDVYINGHYYSLACGHMYRITDNLGNYEDIIVEGNYYSNGDIGAFLGHHNILIREYPDIYRFNIVRI